MDFSSVPRSGGAKYGGSARKRARLSTTRIDDPLTPTLSRSGRIGSNSVDKQSLGVSETNDGATSCDEVEEDAQGGGGGGGAHASPSARRRLAPASSAAAAAAAASSKHELDLLYNESSLTRHTVGRSSHTFASSRSHPPLHRHASSSSLQRNSHAASQSESAPPARRYDQARQRQRQPSLPLSPERDESVGDAREAHHQSRQRQPTATLMPQPHTRSPARRMAHIDPASLHLHSPTPAPSSSAHSDVGAVLSSPSTTNKARDGAFAVELDALLDATAGSASNPAPQRKTFASRMAPRKAANAGPDSMLSTESQPLPPEGSQDESMNAYPHSVWRNAESQPVVALSRSPSPCLNRPSASQSSPSSAHTSPAKSALAQRKRALGVSGVGARKTYAASRSFLAEEADPAFLPPDAELDLNAGAGNAGQQSATSSQPEALSTSRRFLARHNLAVRASYKELKAKFAEGEEEEEEDGPDAPRKSLALRSVTNLRSAGEQRRFDDELEYLLSGLDVSQPLSLRRTSCMDIIKRICTKEAAAKNGFLRGLLAHSDQARNGIVRLWDCFGSARVESITDVILLMHLARASETHALANALLTTRSEEITALLRRGLYRAARGDGSADPFDQRGPNGDLTALADRIRDSRIISSREMSLSLRNLTLCVIIRICALPLRPGFVPYAALLEEENDTNGSSPVRMIVACLRHEAVTCRTRLQAASRGVNIFSAKESSSQRPDIPFVCQALSLLVCVTQHDEQAICPTDERRQIAELVRDLSALLCFLEMTVTKQSTAAPASPVKMTRSQSQSPSKAAHVSLHRLEVTSAEAVIHLLGLLNHLCEQQRDVGHGEWVKAVASASCFVIPLLRLILGVPAFLRSQRAQISMGKSNSPDSEDLSDCSSTPPSHGRKAVEAALLQDLVGAALGLLITLLESAPELMRHNLAGTLISLSCERGKCVEMCRCEKRWQQPAIELLARLFLTERRALQSDAAFGKDEGNDQQQWRAEHSKDHDDASAAGASFLSGCIAVALSLSVVGHPSNLASLLRGLSSSGVTSSRNAAEGFTPVSALEPLISSLEEFAHWNDAVQRRALAEVIADEEEDPTDPDDARQPEEHSGQFRGPAGGGPDAESQFLWERVEDMRKIFASNSSQ
ncbi:Wings apart-like protein [Ceraceosorus bombacis]|uniref:Wings apart-like protein n=1 Tax=Ceraceosorus bombacis TaxID=401625 RepID=A0A0P1BPZ1_9BASI|nr:Wings apart-like protein [Ceraceosorus bombacis]